MPLISPRVPVIVLGISDTSNAYKAGLRVGDVIESIDAVPTAYRDQYEKAMDNRKKGSTIQLIVHRKDSNVAIQTIWEILFE